MSAYAPFNTNYGLTLTKPYLTVAEYQNAPTAIDTANLLPAGSIQQQNAALEEVIARASSLLDQECLGAWGTLNATLDVENARLWGDSYGRFVVNPKYWPILEVASFQYGTTVGTAASIDCASSVWIEPSQFVVQPSGVVGLGLGSLAGVAPRYQYFCEWTYVNGFVNTSLSASVAAAGASVTLKDTTGVYPGTSLTVIDPPNDEQIVVASSYLPGTNPIPLSTGVVSEHNAGVTVTNLPKAVKQAAISMTTVLVKVRGSGALVANEIGEVRQVAQNNPQGAVSDLAMFERGVRALRQMYVGY